MLSLLALAPCDTTGSTSTTLQTVRKPIAELKGTALVWDCVDNPGDITNAKGCIFCGLKFPGGPSRIGSHKLIMGSHIVRWGEDAHVGPVVRHIVHNCPACHEK